MGEVRGGRGSVGLGVYVTNITYQENHIVSGVQN